MTEHDCAGRSFTRGVGVAYGGRTRNLRIHSPLLCRLS